MNRGHPRDVCGSFPQALKLVYHKIVAQAFNSDYLFDICEHGTWEYPWSVTLSHPEEQLSDGVFLWKGDLLVLSPGIELLLSLDVGDLSGKTHFLKEPLLLATFLNLSRCVRLYVRTRFLAKELANAL